MSIRKKLYPWAITLPKKSAIDTATLFGLGNLSMPGTWGSAAGVLLYYIGFKDMKFIPYVIFSLFLAYAAAGICDTAERYIGARDPGQIILDEIVAMPICFFPLFGSAFSVYGVLLGFVLFRFFDIKKPLFISKMQNLEGGLGIVADDLAAAAVTCVCLNLSALAFHGIFA